MKCISRNICFKQHVLLALLLLFISSPSIASTSFDERKFIDKSVQGAFNSLHLTEGFQLITHGRPGELLIEGKWRNAEEIAIFLNSNFQTSNLKHLNIYGCQFAKGDKGRWAVAYLQKALGVSVSASNNITGKNGDWHLEIGTPIAIKGMEGYNDNLQCAESQDTDVIGPNTMSFPNNTYLHNVDGPISTPIEDFNFTVDRVGTTGGIWWNGLLRVRNSSGVAYSGGTIVFNKPLEDFNLYLWNLVSFTSGHGERARFTAYDAEGNPVKWQSYTADPGYEAGSVVTTSGTNNATTTIQGSTSASTNGTARVRFFYDEPISKITIEAEYFGKTATDGYTAFAELQVEGGCARSVLPVTFGDIQAWIQNEGLHINWETLSESNVSHFELEVSQDGEVWRKAGDNIASKALNGSSSAANQYEESIPLGEAAIGLSLLFLSFSTLFRSRKWLGSVIFITGAVILLHSCSKTANPPLDENKKVYVRIKQVDKDGAASYSKVITAIKK